MCGGQFYAMWQRFTSELPFGRYAEQTSQTHDIQIYLAYEVFLTWFCSPYSHRVRFHHSGRPIITPSLSEFSNLCRRSNQFTSDLVKPAWWTSTDASRWFVSQLGRVSLRTTTTTKLHNFLFCAIKIDICHFTMLLLHMSVYISKNINLYVCVCVLYVALTSSECVTNTLGV